jgi:NAD+ kinase
MNTIGIIANEQKPGSRERVRELLDVLTGKKLRIVLDHAASKLAGREREDRSIRELGAADLIVILGGDGTILRAVRELGEKQPPLLGVNLGGLGFLTSVRSEEMMQAMQEVLAGDYTISDRHALQATLLRAGQTVEIHHALNDAVISRGAFSRIVRLRLSIDGEWLTEYVCDGMILATATGSTAYSLSAGGPILLPAARACILTPICPHALSNRSIIAAEESVVRCQVTFAAGELMLTIDGQVQAKLQVGDEVEVRSSPRVVHLVMPKGHAYFEVLRQKLKWSGANV